MWSVGLGGWGLEVGVQGFGFKGWSLEFYVWGLGLGVSGLDLGFGVGLELVRGAGDA